MSAGTSRSINQSSWLGSAVLSILKYSLLRSILSTFYSCLMSIESSRVQNMFKVIASFTSFIPSRLEKTFCLTSVLDLFGIRLSWYAVIRVNPIALTPTLLNHTVDWGQFEFKPDWPLYQPLRRAASTGPTLSYAGSVSTVMARPDFVQYPAYHMPILPIPLA